MEEKLYHGMSIDQIDKKFYIGYRGDESMGETKQLNGKLSELWQEASRYYIDTKNMLSRVEDKLELARESMKLERIKGNKIAPPKQKWSDEARNTEAEVEVMGGVERTFDSTIIKTTERFDLTHDLMDELTIWTEVRKRLDFVASRIESTLIGSGIEAKMDKTFASYNPTKGKESDVHDSDKSKPLIAEQPF